MTNHVAQTCCVPIRKMELLRGELRLLKGAIEQLHGRCELLLCEIIDLQGEHEAPCERLAGESEPGSSDQSPAGEKSHALAHAEELNTALVVPAASIVVGPSDEESRAAVMGEPSSAAAIAACSDARAPIGDTDAAASVAHATR